VKLFLFYLEKPPAKQVVMFFGFAYSDLSGFQNLTGLYQFVILLLIAPFRGFSKPSS